MLRSTGAARALSRSFLRYVEKRLPLSPFLGILGPDDKGKPIERWGRKASGLKTRQSMTAGLPNRAQNPRPLGRRAPAADYTSSDLD